MSIRHYIGWVVLLLAWVPVSGAAEKGACDPWAAKIASIQGKVEAKRASSDKWQATSLNEIFCAGDHIRVGSKSRAGIILANETLVRLDQNTAITLATVEKETPSLVEILKGIAHFISRVPRSLKVNTPFVNAAIEGTEFVVAVYGKQTQVTVFEGTVLTQNSRGEVRITDGESVIASKGSAPSKTLLAKPRDTVQWALYFPPVIATGKGKLSDASNLLNTGRVKEAKKILQAIDSGDAKALLSIIAVVNNDKDTAFKRATQAIKQAPESAAAHIAMSYAWQAKLDLKQSLASAQQAIKSEPNNAIAWARLAELQLSIGELDDALASAKQAAQLNANLSRTQSILGYAHLVRIDIDDATASFNQAIALDQTDPLPHLGLGLAKIRKNDLKQGRREIEVAALLDPNNAIIRSYLGKAYYEEKRGPLDAIQFEMAKAMDPNDPTPYYYDAIRKQTENNPVGALADLNKSIELNDNRAVYRSSLQLDQDEAVRSVSLAKVYQDLGLNKSASIEATHALVSDPANHASHKFLSDTYALVPRHEIARTSERLQSLLLRPLSSAPVLASQSIAFATTPGASQGDISLNELTGLFSRNQNNYLFAGLAGNNGTVGNQTAISGLHDNFAYSFSEYSFSSDGYRTVDNVNHYITNMFLQAELNQKLNLQFEYTNRNTVQGNLDLTFGETSPAASRNSQASDTYRLGLNYSPDSNSRLLASYIFVDKNVVLFTPGVFSSEIVDDRDSNDLQLQYLSSTDNANYLVGISKNKAEGDTSTILRLMGSIVSNTPSTPLDESENVYIYSNIKLTNNSYATVGASCESMDNKTPYRKIDETNYKLGLMLNLSPSLKLRMAGFSNMKRNLITEQTLEPTTIAGFNQFYDDVNGTLTDATGVGLDYSTNKVNAGLEFFQRDLEVPATSGSSFIFTDQNEDLYSGYIAWNITNSISLRVEYLYEKYRNEFVAPELIRNNIIPVELKFHSPTGFFGSLTYTDVEQQVGYASDPGFTKRKEEFGLVDIALGYRFPKREGLFILEINNIGNEQFDYQSLHKLRSDTFNNFSRFIPDQTANMRFQLNF